MKEKIKIIGVPETMIQTLYARAKETKKSDAKIRDEIAVEIVEKLDYDFTKADKDSTMANGVIARTIVLDGMVNDYLNTHSDTIVVNIGCGMDTRCYRMQGKYKLWYNVDLPETINIRKRFLAENGPIYQIAKSAMDTSYTDDITYNGENVLVIMEGLSMYLQEKDIRRIFSIIENAFNKSTIQVLDLYVYNIGMTGRSLSLATAIGILKSIVSVTLLAIVNFVSKKTRGESMI